MRRAICVLIILSAVISPAVLARTSSHSSRTSRASTAPRSAHVRGYTRKDGTYVAPHARAPRGMGAHAATASRPAYPVYRSGHLASGFAAHPSVRTDSHGKIKRSAAAKDAFKRHQPCPSTGRGSGNCPGYVIDHVRPLECGGADDPSNMQWQTVAAGKAKDKTERSCR